nr:hypothetical protein [Streptomyces sp. OK228]
MPGWIESSSTRAPPGLHHGAASAVASNEAELIEGAQADSLMYLIDEAKIVPDGTWDAIEGAFSGGRDEGLPESFALAISTPGPPAGRFYEVHKRAPGLEDWYVRHVTLEEAIAAGRCSSQWAEQRAKQWGRDWAMYANRVLGEFHASDEDSAIPLAWVDVAIERWQEWDQAGRRVLGADVARAGGDSTVLAHRLGLVIAELEIHDREDTMQTTARVQAALGEAPGGAVAVVDSVGVGAGVIDRSRELRVPVLAYTGAAGTKLRTRDGQYGFTNTRSAAYWRLRELLDPAFGARLALHGPHLAARGNQIQGRQFGPASVCGPVGYGNLGFWSGQYTTAAAATRASDCFVEKPSLAYATASSYWPSLSCSHSWAPSSPRALASPSVDMSP